MTTVNEMKVNKLALKTGSKGFECWKFSTSDEKIARDFVSGSSVIHRISL